MFVAVEGIEGSGKSTLLAGLAARLTSGGSNVLVTREPGGTPVGEAVRSIFLDRSIRIDPLTEALLISAARAAHVTGSVRPALAAGRVVLSDRYVDSTLAYQGYGRGLDLDLLRDLCGVATGGLTADLTLLLDVPVEISRERIALRDRIADRLENEEDAFHERVRNGYLEIARAPAHRVLDGSLASEEILTQALSALRELSGVPTERA
ncbi:MAG TPA: dTMP kinase [Candidatus Tumulicola sp.]|jgi:dTMP kinase